jgi:Spondin_N
MKVLNPLVLLTAVATLGACTTDQPTAPLTSELATANVQGAASYTYDVTITNLTTGQPLSPAIAVTHGPRATLFTSGKAASAGIQAIAENGDPSVALGMLTGAPGVYDVVATNAPVHRIGGPGGNTLSFQIKGDAERRLFSLATMLICSNDGFAGIRSVALPMDGTAVTFYAAAYDGGTERNTEADGDIVPPCFGIGPTTGTGGNGRVAEVRTVRMHPGIDGGRALSPMYHGWAGMVAKVTIQRVAAS